MVEAADQMFTAVKLFQYSLCRVVLMVLPISQWRLHTMALSVLALSSRFDGLVVTREKIMPNWSFSTRSVESF